MVRIRRAEIEDMMCVHDMAEIVFRHTYRDILSAEQMDYMMDWMYSPSNLRKQIDEGHVYFIAFRNEIPCGYVSVQQEETAGNGRQMFHLQKIKNPAIGFYLHLGFKILRQGDFHIGNGFYMNDYIMGINVFDTIVPVA